MIKLILLAGCFYFFVSDPSLAEAISPSNYVYLQKGEGGVGLDAKLELSDQLHLALIGCRTDGSNWRLQLGLYPQGDKLPPELEKITQGKDDEILALNFCTNEICEERDWKFFQSGTGDTFFTTVSLPRKVPIKSVRVAFPRETKRYEFRGNFDGVLKKICR